MSGGIWELRRDEITGWWSATVVDRDTGARQAIEAAGYPYLTAITLGDLGL